MRRQRPDQADWSGLCRNKPAWVGYGTHLTESCDPDAKPHLQAVALAAAINVCRFVDYLAGTGLRTTTLSVTELVRGFSDYLNRVAYRGERFILLKGRKPMAELRPLPAGRLLGELDAVLGSLPALTAAEAENYAADMDDEHAMRHSEVCSTTVGATGRSPLRRACQSHESPLGD